MAFWREIWRTYIGHILPIHLQFTMTKQKKKKHLNGKQSLNPLRANYCHTWHMENHPFLWRRIRRVWRIQVCMARKGLTTLTCTTAISPPRRIVATKIWKKKRKKKTSDKTSQLVEHIRCDPAKQKDSHYHESDHVAQLTLIHYTNTKPTAALSWLPTASVMYLSATRQQNMNYSWLD